MDNPQKAPACRCNGETGGTSLDDDDHIDSGLEIKAVRHAVTTIQVEEWLLSAGFWSPAALWAEMKRYDLTCACFMGPFHREVAAAILGHATVGYEPTVESIRFVTEQLGSDWTLGYERLETILYATSHELLASRYAELLTEAIARRNRARELMAEAEQLLAPEPASVIRRPDITATARVGGRARRARRFPHVA